ncbi:Hsp20/alpha crystallin family protein [Nocardioides endophyticus]|uniref:Hsp20/alpha crystallin family protein n=1 Tax=Nocardioides endophyticus TaxID=1353775 RepID=A0ABP8YHR6_9ACTN
MLMRTDPFREFDRLSEALWGNGTRPSVMPLAAYRENGAFVVHLDLPGIDPGRIDVTVEQNVLSVHAERQAPASGAMEALIDERRYGAFDRQLVLGDMLDLDQLSASYDAGVLTIKIPVSEQAQPRKIEVAAGSGPKELAS